MTQKTDLQMLILRSFERHDTPVNTHQLAVEVIMRGGWHPDTQEILAAIEGLRAGGYPVADDDSGVERRYWLDSSLGGDAA